MRAAVGLANPFDALHRGGLSRSVGPDQSKDFPLVDLERRLLDGHGFAVGLADSGDFNDWMHGVFLIIADALTRMPSVKCNSSYQIRIPGE